MRRLPALLAAPDVSVCLPFSDQSAAVLVEAMLALPGPAGAERLADELLADPPLILWAACRAWESSAFRPRSLREITGWLLENAASALDWRELESRRFSLPWTEKQVARFAGQVATDLYVAELSGGLADGGADHVREEARILGLMSGAGRWLLMANDQAGGDPAAILPDWLVRANGTAADCAARALEMANADRAADLPEDDRLPEKAWATEQADSWKREIELLPGFLPPLAEKLRRLDNLQHRFAVSLEAEKLESLAEFAAGAGHEINNPLAIIGGRSQLLLRDEENPERQRELALIIAQVRRANEMIADMRLFSRPPEPELQTFDLAELVERLVAESAEEAAQRRIELVRVGDRQNVRIEADPEQIIVALQAICRNAMEAVGRDGLVEIALRTTPVGAEITFVDHGPGISPEERRHLFDPFYSARQAGRGLGFGLSKAWRIVTNHGGRIEVESEPGEGAAFVVILPRRAQRL